MEIGGERGEGTQNESPNSSRAGLALKHPER